MPRHSPSRAIAGSRMPLAHLPDLRQHGQADCPCKASSAELADLDLGRVLREDVLKRMKPYGLTPTVKVKDLGFALRSADPIPFDMEYCREPGASAAEFMIGGSTGAMVSIVNGEFSPIPFGRMLDPATQWTAPRERRRTAING